MKKQIILVSCIMLATLTDMLGCLAKAQEVDGKGKTLNDIRFQGWEDKDWLDNQYIRTLRQYLNDCNDGTAINSNLAPYKEHLKGKFVVANIQGYLLGGTFIQIIFLDMPDTIFNAWVYSDVDEERETVTDYEVRFIQVEKEKSSFTKADVLRIIKEHPENKLW